MLFRFNIKAQNKLMLANVKRATPPPLSSTERGKSGPVAEVLCPQMTKRGQSYSSYSSSRSGGSEDPALRKGRRAGKREKAGIRVTPASKAELVRGVGRPWAMLLSLGLLKWKRGAA